MSRNRRLLPPWVATLAALAICSPASAGLPPGPGAASSFAILSTTSRVIVGGTARVISQPGNIGATSITTGRSGSFSGNLIAATLSGGAIDLGKATSVQGGCASGGGAIKLRAASACSGGEDSGGTSPLLDTLSNASRDAADFVRALESYTATQSFDTQIKINRLQTATISLAADFNVVDVPAISVGGAATLVLSGAATTSVVIRIAGDFTMGEAARLSLLGGIDPGKVAVLVNGSAVSFANRSSLSGTVLASAGNCRLGNKVGLTGSLVCEGTIRMGNGDVVSVNPISPNLLTAKLYVMDSPLTSAPNVREYPNPAPSGGDLAPLGVLGGPACALFNPLFLTLDRIGSGNLYVSNPNSSSLPQSINVYRQPIAGDRQPSPFIFGSKTSMTSPAGIGLDSSRNIYVADTATNRIVVFPAGSDKNQPPLFAIGGPHAGMSQPIGVALDGDDDVWVVNSMPPISLTKYQNGQCASGSTCDQAPAAMITSSALSHPIDLALDRRGNLWVTNLQGSSGAGVESILQFSPDGTLLATIAGAKTTLSFPIGIAIDGAGNLLSRISRAPT